MAGEWRQVRFGDIADVLPGKYIPVSDYDPGGQYPIFGSNSVMGRSRVPLYDGPIIAFARIGSNCGATMYSPGPCWINNNAGGIRGNERCDTRFLFFWMQNFDFSLIREGSGQPYIGNDALKAQTVDLPPLPEQRAIAHILGTLDDKIELNRRMSETLEAMARALFKAWFVDFEPVRAKSEGRDPGLPKPLADLFPDRLVPSELGEIPEGWEVKGLDEIASFVNGLALQKYPPRDDRTLPVIKIAQLREGNTEGADRCSADLPSEYIVDDGDVLFSWSGSLECVVWTGGKGGLNQHLFRVTSKTYPTWFCYFWIHEYLSEFRYIASDKATTMGHIQRHHLNEAKVVVPSASEVSASDAVLVPLFEQVLQLRLQSRTLATLRDALLPQLISGELRVKDAERFLKERGL